MQNKRYYSYICLPIILMVMAFVGIGCTKEDRSQCAPILLEFKAIVNVNGEEIEVGKDEVKELMLYVFNVNKEFLESYYVEIGSTISLSYPGQKKLHLVCWGNSASDQQTLPAIEVGDKLDESLITLITSNIKATQEIVATHPDNLFHAIKELTIENAKSSTVEMALYHKIASVNITTTGLTTYAIRASEDISYVLRSGMKHINFTGQREGDYVHHVKVAELKNDVYESGIFNILPSIDDNSSVEIDIYEGTELIAIISEDSNGDLIKAKEGELLNIHADFGGDGGISVSVAITPWGEKKVWKDFQ